MLQLDHVFRHVSTIRFTLETLNVLSFLIQVADPEYVIFVEKNILKTGQSD